VRENLWLWWIPFLPLLGSALCAVLHCFTLRARAKHPEAAGPSGLAPWIACGAMLGSLLLSCAGFWALAGSRASALEGPPFDWITAGPFQVQIAMVFDHLASVMCLVVTGVGFLIHVYSAGYMKGDPGYAKFFAYLNLFVFAMLILVLSSSLLGLFIGWEGVGLCSYLLIGFWYEKGWPAEAAQKAFVMNRIGDACFLVGSFLLFDLFRTLDLSEIGTAVFRNPARGTELTLAALCLFGGCCGKSAQIPLFTWLPDAMAGPTPVSALIHAATMVTAGVYLVARLNPLFAAAPDVMLFIAAIGAATAFLGATSALFQRDIKKVLAYSTVSQLGYMFLALGSGAFAAAIFHLVTHAFFKGLLFLGAGSVIHGLHDEQDLHRMGGLRAHMPRTFVTFAAGAAALSGLPLLSGFFSKDEILASAWSAGGPFLVLWIVGIATAALTAFYTWRMVALAFFGPERFDRAHVHPHESPSVMTVPLAILAVLSVFGGVLGLPAVFGVPHLLADWLEPVVAPGVQILVDSGGERELPHAIEWLLLALGAIVASVFAHRGFHAYKGGPEKDEQLARSRPRLAGFFAGAWRVDAFYSANFVQPAKLFAFVTSVVVDQFAIDGLVNGTGRLAVGAGQWLRHGVDGRIKTYALWMGTGAVLIAALWIWTR
jgi:NADH-quinone oxidoreductase subunit L